MNQPDAYLFELLRACSCCKGSFREGAARHMLGTHPMEQFCTYKCLNKFIENSGQLKDVAELPPPAPGHSHLQGFDTAE